MKEHFFKLILVLLIMTTAMAGCINSKPATSINGSGLQSSSPEITEVTLNVIIPQPQFRDQYEKQINQFVAKYQTVKNIAVHIQLEMPSANAYREILMTRLTTDTNLDVFAIDVNQDISQFFKDGYLADMTGEDWINNIYPIVKSAISIDGKVVALPLESLTWGYLYNKKLFTELGLKPAMTITAMSKNVKAIKAAGKTPFLATYHEAWIPQLFLPLITGAFATTTNQDFITKMNAKQSTFADLKGMFKIIDLVNANANQDGLEIGSDEGCAKFASGDYGMWVQGPWFSSAILKSNPAFSFGAAPLPVSENASQTRMNFSISTALVVCSSSKNQAMAKSYVAYFLDQEESSAFFESVQFNPLSSIHTFRPKPWIEEANTYLAAGKAYVDLSVTQDVKDAAGKALQAYYAKTITQNDVVTSLDEAWKKSK